MAPMTEAPRRRRHDGDGEVDDAPDHNRVNEILRAEVARRAYEFFVARGCEHGHDIDDWLMAEREFLKRR